MTLRLDGREYHAQSAAALIEQIKGIRWDADQLPTAESYIEEMARTYKRVTRRTLRLPKADTETRARAMLAALADIGTWDYKEEE